MGHPNHPDLVQRTRAVLRRHFPHTRFELDPGVIARLGAALHQPGDPAPPAAGDHVVVVWVDGPGYRAVEQAVGEAGLSSLWLTRTLSATGFTAVALELAADGDDDGLPYPTDPTNALFRYRVMLQAVHVSLVRGVDITEADWSAAALLAAAAAVPAPRTDTFGGTPHVEDATAALGRFLRQHGGLAAWRAAAAAVLAPA